MHTSCRRAALVAAILILVGCGSGGALDGAGGRGGSTAPGAAGEGGPCHGDSDCAAPARCQPSGAFVCGSAAHPWATDLTFCSQDSDCASDAGVSMVCDTRNCMDPSGSACVPGCTQDADCPRPDMCTADHHCRAIPCSPGSPDSCPANMVCGASDFCAVKSCQSDAECSGSCVNGFCSGTPGACQTIQLP